MPAGTGSVWPLVPCRDPEYSQVPVLPLGPAPLGTRGKRIGQDLVPQEPLVMATTVKEEPEAPYSLSLLLSDRNTRCRNMTASAIGQPAPSSPALQHHTCGVQQQQTPSQPIANGVGSFERVSSHSPSNVPPVEGAKRHPSPVKPTANDPLSHRIIEKRRRDRMNNCLADLSRLIPTYYLKKGRGRIEKTEIIEMAIKYMKHLQAHACSQIENCEVTAKQEKTGNQLEQFHLGYQECMSETMQFLVESEGFFSGDSLCVRLMNHLTKHCEKILNSEGYVARQSGASSSSSGYHANSSSAGSSSDGNGSGSTHNSEKESAYRSEDRSGGDEREEKLSGSSSLDSSSGVGSQLREILQQHSGPGSSGERRCGGYSSGLSSNNSSSGDDNNNTNTSRLYKFKSNMKHRFSADLEQSHQVRKKRRDSESSCGNYTDYEKDRVTPTAPSSRGLSQDGFPTDSSKLLDEQDSPALDKNHRCPTPIPKCENHVGNTSPCRQVPEMGPAGTVPIFALNQNGSFYVPLTIDNSLIAPVMSGLSDISPVLHPISISVNFCGPFPTITSSIVPPSQPGCAGPHMPNSHHLLAGRYSSVTHGPSLNAFESGPYNGRLHTRIPYDRKRRDPVRQNTQCEDPRIGMPAGGPEGVEKREFNEMDMREQYHHHHHHHHHHPLHQEAPPRDTGRDLPSWLEHMRDVKDSKDQEKSQEMRDMRNMRNGNLKDIREAREMWEMHDSAQTVREYIDNSGNYPKNGTYSRTPQNWTPTYHIQPKN